VSRQKHGGELTLIKKKGKRGTFERREWGRLSPDQSNHDGFGWSRASDTKTMREEKRSKEKHNILGEEGGRKKLCRGRGTKKASADEKSTGHRKRITVNSAFRLGGPSMENGGNKNESRSNFGVSEKMERKRKGTENEPQGANIQPNLEGKR